MRSGLKDTQIVERLDREHHIRVTRQAISAWRKRRGMNMQPQPPRAMPWDLRPEHRTLEPARAIRLYARRERGEKLPPEEQERLDRALANLDAVKDEPGFGGRRGVFHYERDTDEGWFIVPRRPGVDHGIVREPKA